MATAAGSEEGEGNQGTNEEPLRHRHNTLVQPIISGGVAVQDVGTQDLENKGSLYQQAYINYIHGIVLSHVIEAELDTNYNVRCILLFFFISIIFIILISHLTISSLTS